MPRILIALAAAALSAPAFAQQAPDPLEEERGRSWVRPGDEPADAFVRAIPPAEEIEAMAPALDRAVGALLDVDVGPILDAADPMRRRPGYGRPGRTLGELGRRDDPYFEERLRSSIYDSTADMSRMVGAFAAAAPALARSLREMEQAMGAAIEDYRRRRGDSYPDD